MTVRRATELDDTLVRNPHLNFAPWLGIAYQLNSKTVIRTGYGIYFGFPDVVNAVPSLNPPSRVRFDLIGNNINPTLFIDKPQVPADPFSTAPMNPFMTARDPNTRPDFTQMYNLSVQRQLGGNVVVEVGFMGSRSSRILIDDPINNAVPALPNDTSSTQSRRRPNLLGAFSYLAPQGFSNYNASCQR